MAHKSAGRDYYAVLGIDRTADPGAIKAAWRRLAKAKHPDKNPDNPNATVEFQLLESAYSTLKDSRQRAAYDEQLSAHSAEPKGGKTAAGRGSGEAPKCETRGDWIRDLGERLVAVRAARARAQQRFEAANCEYDNLHETARETEELGVQRGLIDTNEFVFGGGGGGRKKPNLWASLAGTLAGAAKSERRKREERAWREAWEQRRGDLRAGLRAVGKQRDCEADALRAAFAAHACLADELASLEREERMERQREREREMERKRERKRGKEELRKERERRTHSWRRAMSVAEEEEQDEGREKERTEWVDDDYEYDRRRYRMRQHEREAERRNKVSSG
ncbi:hypothetical protein GGS23DRAFT_445573 [Durotheca rogersii]|uniref:uncharacterized protein n=1 Tax=Durotheca rogersii TaxID=419775 RepID=UPI00221F987E|nr:uncharacterized protein GGS23DRAFT_445573 [Durotheca rogersii]KAI5855134.1 hypothetical protein GGS23DRAFT_445573 [Durotheca rogersii]